MNTFEQNLKDLSSRVLNLKENILTEEATKHAFILPFLQILGYDIFNPLEVIPEFVADQSSKKDEKVDFCLKKEGEPIIILECKHWEKNLDLHGTQLERYFAFTKARFGILSNGIQYRFYTDLEEKNKMDLKPFFEFDLENLKDTSLIEILKYHKNNFDAEEIFNAAGQLKYTKQVRQVFEQELKDPSPDFVRHFAGQVYSGRLTGNVLGQFGLIVKRALTQTINEIISERLHKALSQEEEKQKSENVEVTDPAQIIRFEDPDRGIVTTQEEIDGFEIVRDILKDQIEDERIAHRDTKSYFGILLDDNNRKPLCRLYLGNGKKYIGIFSTDKKEVRHQIEKVEHIYMHSGAISETLQHYLSA